MLQTIDQFEYDGCENCEKYLHMKNNRDAVYDYTSSSFDGLIAMASPEDSWVAKWQRIGICDMLYKLNQLHLYSSLNIKYKIFYSN